MEKIRKTEKFTKNGKMTKNKTMRIILGVKTTITNIPKNTRLTLLTKILLFLSLMHPYVTFPDIYEELSRQKRVIRTIDSGKIDLGGTPISYKILHVKNVEEVVKVRKQELESNGFSTSLHKNKSNIYLTAVRYLNEEKIDMVSIQGIKSGKTDYIIESIFNLADTRNLLLIKPEKIKQLTSLGFIMLNTDKQTYLDISDRAKILIQFLPTEKDKAKRFLVENAKSEGWNEMDKEQMFAFFQQAIEKSGLFSLMTHNTFQNILQGKPKDAESKIQMIKSYEKQIEKSIKSLREIMNDTIILTKNSKELIIRIEDVQKFPEFKKYFQQNIKDAKTIVVQIMMLKDGGENQNEK